MTTAAEPGIRLEQLAVRGDRDALRQLLGLHGPVIARKLEGKIPARFRSVLSVEDVMQEAFTDVFLDIGKCTFEKSGSFEAWLNRIARHNLLNALRDLRTEKRGGNRIRVAPVNTQDSYNALVETIAHTNSTPSRNIAKSEIQMAVERAVRQLPDIYQAIVRMYDLEGRPSSEVAARLNRSIGAMFMARNRALRLMGDFLGTGSKFFSYG